MYGVGGAASRPMAWSGGGSTKPPMVNNYLDSHGLNAGLGNSANTQFPSVVDSRPMQVQRQETLDQRQETLDLPYLTLLCDNLKK
jgi:hypothetical protein